MECKYILDLESYHQLNTIKDKEMSQKTQSKKVTIFNLKIERLSKRSTVIDISRNLLDQ